MQYGLSEKVISELRTVFSRFNKVEKVYLFGSRAKGNYRNGSDIDLAVTAKDLTYADLMNMSMAIDDLGLLYHIDLIDYDKKRDTPIGEHINRVGKTFYERDNKAL